MDRYCAICGKEWGDHQAAGTLCPTGSGWGTTKFRGCVIKDASVGDRVEMYCNDDLDAVLPHGTTKTVIGTVITTDNQELQRSYGSSPSSLFGWKDDTEVRPSTAWTRGNPISGKYLPQDYKYGLWVPHNYKAMRIIKASTLVATPITKGGMKCAVGSCGEYNEYAAPNQPDGRTYICYSCRQAGRH